MTKSTSKNTAANTPLVRDEILEELVHSGADIEEVMDRILAAAPDGCEPSKAFVEAVAAACFIAEQSGSEIVVSFEPEVIELHFGPVPGRHTIH